MPRGKQIVFDGVTYPSRLALARHHAPRIGRPYTAVATALVIYHDDVAAVLALYDRLNVKLENETFASQHAFCQALHRRHGVPQGTLRYWAKHFSPAEVLAKAEIGPVSMSGVADVNALDEPFSPRPTLDSLRSRYSAGSDFG